MIDVTWGSASFPLRIFASHTTPVMLSIASDIEADEPAREHHRARPGLVEVLAVGEGRGLNSTRAIRTTIGDRLRYASHRVETAVGSETLVIEQTDAETGLVATTRFARFDGVDAYRATTTVRNDGDQTIALQQVTSATVLGLTRALGVTHDLDLWTARSEWCAESRWGATALSSPAGIVDINTEIHGHFARGSFSQLSSSTWSSGTFLPTAVLTNRESQHTLAWQIENSGPWKWELDTLFDPTEALALALLGPTDLDHAWTTLLEPGESFTTVPASLAFSADGVTGAIGELTRHRRASHLFVGPDENRRLIFNDYMNALMGDPTTEKLLPLIDAAADVGADTFCIDAGWYDDGTDWWPSVGAWEPSTTRFQPGGLQAVLDHIRERGMTPGLWMEPEVIGVRSPIATELPEDAFMHRHGIRIVEHDRYFLDFRSASARDYLDAVFARLVEEYGARYFKWDYNVTPGSGPDTDASGPGEGLLDHARAHLAWVEALRRRYPDVVLEACSSGAMRMDASILARYDLQSTTDQQDYRLYPVIAAAAPMSMPLEMAGNWAYPQPEWDDEQVAFTFVTGLSGRLYMSGHPNTLGASQLALVKEAAELYPEIIRHHAQALPSWPLGLPEWESPQVALSSDLDNTSYVFVWNRDADATTKIQLALPRFQGDAVDVSIVFPTQLTSWQMTWDSASGQLEIDLDGVGEAARVIRITRR